MPHDAETLRRVHEMRERIMRSMTERELAEYEAMGRLRADAADPARLRRELREVLRSGLRLAAYAGNVARCGIGTRDVMGALVTDFEERAESARATLDVAE